MALRETTRQMGNVTTEQGKTPFIVKKRVLEQLNSDVRSLGVVRIVESPLQGSEITQCRIVFEAFHPQDAKPPYQQLVAFTVIGLQTSVSVADLLSQAREVLRSANIIE